MLDGHSPVPVQLPLMPKPRDHHVVDRVGLVRLARIFSNVVSPPVMFAVLGLALALRAKPLWPALGWAAVYGFFVSLGPILFVLYLLRTGRIMELHMSDTRERHLPYVVAALGSLIVVALLLALKGPKLLVCLALFNLLTLYTIGVVNTRWLISFHAAAAMAMDTIVALVFGPAAGLALSPVVGLVFVVRLYLRRHTASQVMAGLVVGAFSVLVLRGVGCFVL